VLYVDESRIGFELTIHETFRLIIQARKTPQNTEAFSRFVAAAFPWRRLDSRGANADWTPLFFSSWCAEPLDSPIQSSGPIRYAIVDGIDVQPATRTRAIAQEKGTQMTKIVLDNDGRIYAAPNVKALVRTIYKASTIFDGSRNVREWMEGIAKRGQIGGFTQRKISTTSEEAFFRDCVRAKLQQGSKVQP
jgi:hypothetical protein